MKYERKFGGGAGTVLPCIHEPEKSPFVRPYEKVDCGWRLGETKETHRTLEESLFFITFPKISVVSRSYDQM